MNRKGFLAELKNLLSFLDPGDRAEVLRQYEELFDAAGPEGEEELLASLGSPVRQVLKIEREYRDRPATREESVPAEEYIPAEEYVPAEEAAPAEEYIPAEEPVPAKEPVPGGETSGYYTPTAPAGAWIPTEPANTWAPTAPAGAWTPTAPAGGWAPNEPAGAWAPTEPPKVWTPRGDMPAGSGFDIPRAEPVLEATFEIVEEPRQNAAPTFSMPEGREEPVSREEPASGDPLLSHMSASMTENAPAEEPVKEPAEAPAESTSSRESGEKVGAGRVFGAILVTLPMIALGLVGFAVALALGAAFLALGGVCAVAAVYCGGYVFGGVITYMPDILLVAGLMLAGACFGLLFLWTGLWIAAGGIILTVRTIGSVYAGILKKEGRYND